MHDGNIAGPRPAVATPAASRCGRAVAATQGDAGDRVDQQPAVRHAAYTAALERQLADAFDITVFDLDQYLMGSRQRRVRRLADRQVKQIGRALHGFDLVNLQLEHGTLGRSGSDIFRRFCWLTKAAPRLMVTFHSLPLPPAFDAAAFFRAVATLNFKAAAQLHSSFRRV
jgi:hypothetical protein